MKTKNTELLNEIKKQNFIIEKQILLLKHRIQKQFYENKNDELEEFENFMFKNNFEINLTNEQKHKGIEYIKKQYFTKFGYLRNNKNIKFKKEILKVLEEFFSVDFFHREFNFKFCGFAIISNGIMNFYEPIYKLELNYYLYKKSFLYFHFNGIDYEFIRDNYLKDNNILFVSGRI